MLEGIPTVDVAADGIQAIQMVRAKMEGALKIQLPPLNIEAITREHAMSEGASSHPVHAEPVYEAALSTLHGGGTGAAQASDTSGSSHFTATGGFRQDLSVLLSASPPVSDIGTPTDCALAQNIQQHFPQGSPESQPGTPEATSELAHGSAFSARALASASSGSANALQQRSRTSSSQNAALAALLGAALPPNTTQFSSGAGAPVLSSFHHRSTSSVNSRCSTPVAAGTIVLPAAQTRCVEQGRHHSFPSMPSMPAVQPMSHTLGSQSMQTAAASPVNMSSFARSRAGSQPGQASDTGLVSPQSPATPLFMPRTPQLDSQSNAPCSSYQMPLASSGISPASAAAQAQAQLAARNARHASFPLPSRTSGLPQTGGAAGAAPSSMAAKAQYDVIVTDLQMPRCSGLQEASLIRELEAQFNLPPVPIIAVTSNTLLSDRVACARRDITWFLCKPFARREILSVLELISHERQLQALSLAPLRRALDNETARSTLNETPPSASSGSVSSSHADSTSTVDARDGSSTHTDSTTLSGIEGSIVAYHAEPFLTMLPAAILQGQTHSAVGAGSTAHDPSSTPNSADVGSGFMSPVDSRSLLPLSHASSAASARITGGGGLDSSYTCAALESTAASAFSSVVSSAQSSPGELAAMARASAMMAWPPAMQL